MTKEELKKEAIKFAVGYPTSYGKGYKHKDLRIAYLAGAEPREKRIEELDKENGKLEGKLADLQSEYVELENFKNNEVNELKAQLTKAGGIITNLVTFDGSYEDDEEFQHQNEMYDKIWAEAEQFLKEVKNDR